MASVHGKRVAIHVTLNHRTHYRYERPIQLGPQTIRLRPAPHSQTPILSYSLKIRPDDHFVNWQQDPQSNYLARLVFPEPTREFYIEVDLTAEISTRNPFDFFLEDSASEYPFGYDPVLEHELKPFLEKVPLTKELKSYVAAVDKTKRRTIDFLVELNQKLNDDIGYVIRMEPGVQSCEETLQKKKGSCRDSAWLLVQVLRHCGLAARFVSGYLIQLKPDQKSLDGPSGSEEDFTDLHAWTEVYLPGAGWVGLDPTSGLLAGEGHIPLAATPDTPSAAPISGSLEDCKVDFDFSMTIERTRETPRVTKPYSEEQWEKIVQLGHELDRRLDSDDVRLTMGGEPTFVSIDDMDGDEWNTGALGPTKRERAHDLLRRLHSRFAPGGLLHFGQGKWYPGESLPRWAFGCYWRKDGEPIWRDMNLVADERRSYSFDENDSQRFTQTLADRLDVDANFVLPAYEDAWYYMWKERRLPGNVDPIKSNLENKEERARLAKVFEQGLGKVVGHALPVKREWSHLGPYWMSGDWFLRPENLFLIPGDSPMGLRLPLDSLPWVTSSDYPYLREPDPLLERSPLPRRDPRNPQRFIRGAEQPNLTVEMARRYGFSENVDPAELLKEIQKLRDQHVQSSPGQGESASWIVRTALCVEPRNGILHIFMPPTESLEDYLDLVEAIEDTAANLKTPVQLEGYVPPHDPRVNVLKVTPDPGVIEVNIHPSHNWEEMVDVTTGIYEDARQSRLGTEKFMMDGRHTGTGGGNHIILGGERPSDSPLLRRPDLLKSLINYWNNHPSLSFLFSGLFIGPTSQSPRIDEARNDSIYEMDIAFRQVPTGSSVPPWLVDRVFRNLLIDASGNTHRSEFSIDKLYSPDAASTRLGLLELRSFEMPPHARMSLTQQLLLRGLISAFWREPYENPLVRWGTEVHDRFMLPHFVQQDFEDVMQDMRRWDIPFDAEWFDPHYEFRFPAYGDITHRGVNLEVRHALEPWHVLGEEDGGSGTVRFVDSSVERLQIKTQGMVDPRYVVSCNGHQLPLHPTGTNGEYVCGVRYRAWQPASCLHPTIPVHGPLTFDIVDTWSHSSLGGCSYHVSHPGGLSYDTLPVNSNEAESRRHSRFFKLGHSPGAIHPIPTEPSREYPFTLDLRLT